MPEKNSGQEISRFWTIDAAQRNSTDHYSERAALKNRIEREGTVELLSSGQ
jgi:hypothetical protein